MTHICYALPHTARTMEPTAPTALMDRHALEAA